MRHFLSLFIKNFFATSFSIFRGTVYIASESEALEASSSLGLHGYRLKFLKVSSKEKAIPDELVLLIRNLLEKIIIERSNVITDSKITEFICERFLKTFVVL